MELRQLRYFVAVAEELNYNRAAQQLRVAQPALSQQIRQLEKELAVNLFDRSKRQIQLTAAGRALLADSHRLLDGVEMVKRTAQRAERGELGRLVIGFVPMACWWLTDTMTVFRKQFPEVELMFEELASFEQLEALPRNQIDLGVVVGPQNEPNLREQLVSRTPFLIALPAQHRLALQAGSEVQWQDMATERFIVVPRRNQPQIFDQFVGRCQAAGFSPNIFKEAAQTETILNLVAAGRGIALVPAYLKERVQWEGIVFKSLEEPCPKFEIFAVWRNDDNSILLQNFINLIPN